MLRIFAFIGLFVLSILAGGQVPMTGAGLGTPAVSCSFSTIDFTTGSLETASLSRSSSATYINVSGVLSTATTNTARFNYDANYPRGNVAPSLTGPFLLVEPAATNLILQSNAFNTTWFKVNSAVATSGVFPSPDGTLDGWSLTSGTAFGSTAQGFTFSNIQYAISVWANRQLSTPPLLLQLAAVNSGNITTSATTTRYASALTPAAGASNAGIAVNAGASNTVGIFGAQLETGAVATSYIATTTGSASRSADVVTFTQPAGCGHNTYTFDDNSTQSVTQAAGSATVPTNLNRPNIKKIDGST